MDACHILLGRPWQFDTEAVHEGKRNVYSFEMNRKKHSLQPFRGKQEEVNNHLLMMTDKIMVSDWNVEAKVKVISQINDYEVEMTNVVCSDWLKEKSDQQEMSNASITLMEEAHHVVIEDDENYMVDEITEDDKVAEASKGEKGQIIHAHNSWKTNIFVLIYFLFDCIT